MVIVLNVEIVFYCVLSATSNDICDSFYEVADLDDKEIGVNDWDVVMDIVFSYDLIISVVKDVLSIMNYDIPRYRQDFNLCVSNVKVNNFVVVPDFHLDDDHSNVSHCIYALD